jgi:hypothetical protein
VPLDRNGRARFRYLLHAHRAAKRLTADAVAVGEMLVRALGDDGRLDLAHATIAARAQCHVATVKRALVKLRALGLVDWVRRLVRDARSGWRCEQASNAYQLRAAACEAQPARPVQLIRFKKEALEGCGGWEAQVQEATRQLAALGMPAPAVWGAARP